MELPDSLPDGASASLTLLHPSPDEKLHQFKLNGTEWRGALSQEAYLHREDVLANQALTRDGGITYWILVDGTATPNATDPAFPSRLPLASCETYRKRALVWEHGEVQETICHGIGSVFCAPQMRGRRYAQRMMQEVGRALQTHQANKDRPCLFSILFSDIGKGFYAKYGWEPFPSSHVSVPARGPQTDTSDVQGARLLYAADLAELCAVDEALIRERLQARPRGSNTAFALIPDVATMQWHHAREEFVSAQVCGKEPRVKGAIVGAEKGKRIWMYWTRVWSSNNPQESRGNTLHVLRLVSEEHDRSMERDERVGDTDSEAMIMSLLAVAQEEAKKWNMEQVELWNPTQVTLAAARRLCPTVERVEREEESIASVRWHADREGQLTESMEWMCNEKYAWC